MHEVTFKPDADHGTAITERDQTPVEERAGPLESNQHLEGDPTASTSQCQEEEKPSASGPTSGDETGSLERQGTPVTKAELGNGNIESDGSVVAISRTSDTTKVDTLVQKVKGPAELEESSPNPSEVEQDVTQEKSVHSEQMTQTDRRQQVVEVKVVEEKEKILSESRQGSGCDSAATHSSDSGTSKDTASSLKESEQKLPETHDLPGSASRKEDNKTNVVSFFAFLNLILKLNRSQNIEWSYAAFL